MAIVKMNKFTLLAFESEKDKLLEQLQAFEGVEFINLQDEDFIKKNKKLKKLNKDLLGSKYMEDEENLSKIKFALNFLENYMDQQSSIKTFIQGKKTVSYKQLNENFKKSNWETIYKILKQKNKELTKLENEKTKLETEIENLYVWRNFDERFLTLKKLKYTHYFMGYIPKQHKSAFERKFEKEISLGYVQYLEEDNENIYMLILVLKEQENKAKDLCRKYEFNFFNITYDESPMEIITSYKDRIFQIFQKKQEYEKYLKSLTCEYEQLQFAYEYFKNNLLKQESYNNFLKSEKIVVIYGWNETESNDELENVVKTAIGDNYYINFEKIKDDELDKVPIKLKNNGFVAPFESIVEMYSLPLYKEIDPTPLLAIFYFIFFGMMLSDAGYGLVIMIASYFGIKHVKDKNKKNTFKLFFFAGLSTLIWGAIYGGWFGDIFQTYFNIKIPQILDPAKSITKILILSVIFGLIHIFVGLGIKAYCLIKNGLIKDAIYDVATWYFVLIGSILALTKVGGVFGKIILIIGLIGLLLTQGRNSKTLGGKIGGGIYGVYGVTSYLGDVVSYSRLLALGLATGFIANALNLIISLFPAPVSYILAPILFVILHLFNLLVNGLGSYVHAARLQYLEFFNKFYEGGGKNFTPFKYSNEYINVKKDS